MRINDIGATKCCIQRRYSSNVGRKSRLKRERSEATSFDDAELALEPSPEVRADIEVLIAPPSPGAPRPKQSRKRRPVGARVARVAVDDATWLAFKKLCGSTPASIRLGQLVGAEVERARQPAPEPDAVAAVQAIRAHVDQLEAFVRSTPRQ